MRPPLRWRRRWVKVRRASEDRNTLTITNNIIKRMLRTSFALGFPSVDDALEISSLERSATDKTTVYIRFGKDFFGI